MPSLSCPKDGAGAGAGATGRGAGFRELLLSFSFFSLRTSLIRFRNFAFSPSFSLCFVAASSEMNLAKQADQKLSCEM